MTQAAVLMLPQLGIEVTPGTPVAATKSLGAMRIEPNIEVSIEEFSASGYKTNNLTIFQQERMTASTPGKPTYTEIVYPLSGVLGTANVALASGATTAQEWTFSPSANAADTPVTYTVEIVGPDRSYRFAYGLQNQFGLSVSRTPSGGTIDLSGTMVGQALEDGVTPTASASVTALELIPMTPLQFDLYIDDDAASLGTTQYSDAFMVEWSYGPKYSLAEFLDSSESSFTGHYEVQTPSTMNIRFEREATSSALLTAMRSNTTKFIRLAASGATDAIESGHTYGFTLDFAGQITTSSLGTDDDLATINFGFTNVFDPTWENSLEVVITNDIAAL